MDEHGCYTINVGRVIHETLDDEALVIDSENGHYHSIAGTGAVIWDMLVGAQSRSSIVAKVASLYGADVASVQSDVDGFLDRLHASYLIIGTNSPVSSSSPASRSFLQYTPPEIRSHTDLEDLLLFDPIHEVGQAGWPERQT
ncbi:MAG: PqqD family protein [Acidimicrobiales bacterium]